MTTKRVRFKNASRLLLAGLLDLPAGDPKALALVAHCFTCGKSLKSMANIAKALCKHGVAVFRFDFTGVGDSRGEFADTNFSTSLDDLLAAAAYLKQVYRPPDMLIGHSLGGAAVLIVAGQITEVKVVATIAAPSSTKSLAKTLVQQLPELENLGKAELVLAGRRFIIKKQLLDDLYAHSMDDHIAKLGHPLMIFHSPADQIVPIDNARRIFEQAKHPKSFVSLDRADHLLLLDPADAPMVAGILEAWVNRYI